MPRQTGLSPARCATSLCANDGALLNPLVGVRLLHVLEQARPAEDPAAEVAKLRVQVAYRGSAIVTLLLGSSCANVANRIFYVPRFHYFAVARAAQRGRTA